jgi:hypothetical protein
MQCCSAAATCTHTRRTVRQWSSHPQAQTHLCLLVVYRERGLYHLHNRVSQLSHLHDLLPREALQKPGLCRVEPVLWVQLAHTVHHLQ